MSKYVNLDISIMSKLSETPSPFSRLFSGDVGAECVDIAKDEGDKKRAVPHPRPPITGLA